MRIRRFGDYLVQITKWAAAFPMNSYVVIEDDGLTVVDSTMSSPGAEVAKVAEQMGKRVRRVILTHAHGDHVGGVAGLRETFPGVTVSISERDARLLKGDKSLDPSEPQDNVRGYFVKIEWEPDGLLKPGDRVGSLEVLASPGHTPGHVAFLDTRDRSLVAGDAFQTRGGIAVSGVLRPLFPFPAMATWHKPTALATAERLLEVNPSRLAVGHGEVLEAPAGPMRGAVESARRAWA